MGVLKGFLNHVENELNFNTYFLTEDVVFLISPTNDDEVIIILKMDILEIVESYRLEYDKNSAITYYSYTDSFEYNMLKTYLKILKEENINERKNKKQPC